METYVTLGMGMGQQSEDAGQKAMEKVGCKVVGSYMLMGQFDYLTIFEAPDAHSASMAVYLAKKAAGLESSQSQTMRAFTEKDIEKFMEMSKKLEG